MTETPKVILGEFIGSGASGQVYKGTWNGLDVAIKLVTCPDKSEKEELDKTLMEEVKIHKQLKYENIISLYDAMPYNNNSMAIITEFAENGSLDSVLRNKKFTLDWPERWRYVEEIARGVSYLHNQNIIHRDLKSANVLLNKHMQIKLCDFGLSGTITILSRGSKASVENHMAGTYPWMAPELFAMNPKVGRKCDIYSFAMTIWEIASRSKPFKDYPLQAMIGALALKQN